MPFSLAILQSNYLPWKGYFDIIGRVDLFLFYDDRQYTRSDWRNRNRIVTPNGIQWLTIPCQGGRDKLICEVRPADDRWQRQHWNALTRAYGRAEFWKEYAPFFEEFYLGRTWDNLSQLNQFLLRRIAGDFLGFATRFDETRRFPVSGDKRERIMALIGAVGAVEGGVSRYVTGPSAADYLDAREFERMGIELEFMDYSGYPEYRQQHEPFVHEVSIVDLLFREGPRAREFMKSRRDAG